MRGSDGSFRWEPGAFRHETHPSQRMQVKKYLMYAAK
jgi:hypothetical protein